MSALIAMAVHDTEENGRSKYTVETIQRINATVDLTKHNLIIIDNGSCNETKELLKSFYDYTHAKGKRCDIITNDINLGTAGAINKAMQLLNPGEYFIKIDNDVAIYQTGWVDTMIEVMKRSPQLGILGLKRKDLQESQYHLNTDYRSKLVQVSHKPGEKWYVIEVCKHIMGTCTMLSPDLIKKVGYFYQMDGLYGFDDSIMSVRSRVAGFTNAFLPHIEIDHLDPGGDTYTEWKKQEAARMLPLWSQCERDLLEGRRNYYYNPYSV